jgi:hypothetical protein
MLDSATIATAADENPAPGDSNASLVWIYAPWIGMLIGCGAWSAPLVILTGYIRQFVVVCV